MTAINAPDWTAGVGDEQVISCADTLDVDRYVPYPSALTSLLMHNHKE
jgi:hypothetical protein